MNPTRPTFDLNRRRVNRLAWLAAHTVPSLALLVLTMAGGSFAPAQDTNAPVQANDALQPGEMVPANDNGQSDDETSGDDMVETNSVAQTNGTAPGPTEDARSRRLRRQRQNRNRNYGQSNTNGSAGGTNAAPASLDYSAFRLIADRNIFDPNRFPHTGPRVSTSRTVDSFSLVGTMSYEKGDFAFFDGTSSDFKKVLKPADTIAGYKVVAISPDSVKLAQSTNQLVLAVGTQMRRQDDGTWVQVASAASYDSAPAAPSSTSSPPSASGGAESDVLKRMMQRREKE